MLLGRKPILTVGFMSGVPAVLNDFWWSTVQMVQFNQECLCNDNEYVEYLPAPNSFHASARNSFVDRMKSDILLQIDCDHRFDPDICQRMLDRMATGIDVLVGCYVHKGHPHAPVLFDWQDGEMPQPLASWESDSENTLYECKTAGAGCLMVRKCVFDRIKEELGEAPFSIIHPFGEDHSFFKRVMKLDIPTWFDPRIEANHLVINPLSLSDFDTSAVQIKRKESEGLAWQRQ